MAFAACTARATNHPHPIISGLGGSERVGDVLDPDGLIGGHDDGDDVEPCGQSGGVSAGEVVVGDGLNVFAFCGIDGGGWTGVAIRGAGFDLCKNDRLRQAFAGRLLERNDIGLAGWAAIVARKDFEPLLFQEAFGQRLATLPEVILPGAGRRALAKGPHALGLLGLFGLIGLGSLLGSLDFLGGLGFLDRFGDS